MISNGGAGGGEERASRARAGAALVWRGGRDVVARCERWRRCAGWRRGVGWRVASGVGRGQRGRSGASEKAGAARLASACGREAAPGCSSGGHIAPSRAAAARGAVARTGVQPHFSDSRVPNGKFFSSSLHFARLRVCGTGYRVSAGGRTELLHYCDFVRRFAIGMRKASAEAARARVCCG